MSRKFAVYVIRHADAGKRGVIDDDRRPLSARGCTQSAAIAAALTGAGIERVLSSPYVRCHQTVEPLAGALGLTVERVTELAEGGGAAGALALVESATAPIALCSHGDVIGDLLVTLDRRGVSLDDDRLAKASTWVLTVRDGEVQRAHYEPPPR